MIVAMSAAFQARPGNIHVQMGDPSIHVVALDSICPTNLLLISSFKLLFLNSWIPAYLGD